MRWPTDRNTAEALYSYFDRPPEQVSEALRLAAELLVARSRAGVIIGVEATVAALAEQGLERGPFEAISLLRSEVAQRLETIN